MKAQTLPPDKRIALFVKTIWTFESKEEQLKTSLPFFADGYPGLLFQQTTGGLKVNPHRKQMPVSFLYGQTIHPIALEMNGPFRIVIFQLYPFVLKNIFGLDPQSIQDNCYDLAQLNSVQMERFNQQMLALPNLEEQVEQIATLLHELFLSKKEDFDLTVKHMIELIMQSKGQAKIGDLAAQLQVSVRTLERKFFKETGLSPKKFATIIQFQSSLTQLTVRDFTSLADIVYENGFADQSHFIKVFKVFTGKTPKTFKDN